MKKNNKGFTLAELLIVVAIIAVLVAIAIPVFTTQLEKSRDAVTISNIRAAYAEAMTMYLTANHDGETDASGRVTYVNKNKVTVSGVIGKGKSSSPANLADMAKELPGTKDATPVTWTLGALEAADGKASTLKFAFSDAGVLTSVTAGAAA